MKARGAAKFQERRDDAGCAEQEVHLWEPRWHSHNKNAFSLFSTEGVVPCLVRCGGLILAPIMSWCCCGLPQAGKLSDCLENMSIEKQTPRTAHRAGSAMRSAEVQPRSTCAWHICCTLTGLWKPSAGSRSHACLSHETGCFVFSLLPRRLQARLGMACLCGCVGPSLVCALRPILSQLRALVDVAMGVTCFFWLVPAGALWLVT